MRLHLRRIRATMRPMDSEAVLIERWHKLLTCYNEVACHLERALQDGHGLTVSEFETLDRLIAPGCDKRRMQDLAADMYLSQSALSRAVARLEKSGLVERALCEVDRRGVFVKVTDAGSSTHADACRTRVKVLAEHLSADDSPV